MSYDDLGDISLSPEFVEMFDSMVTNAEADVASKRGDSLGDRMKGYESKQTLDSTTPVIIRVDGRTMREIIKQKLQLVDKLWGAQVGTSEGDELDELIDEVEALEKRYVFE